MRDRTTGTPREARPADIAILFRSRDSHRDFETALEARGVSTYVYKGLGFFDADEIQDAVALLRYLADPLSDLRAAALLRSRIVRLSDRAVARIADDPAAIILGSTPVPALADEDRRVLERLRASVGSWLSSVDRLTPSALLDAVLDETAYAYELRGPRRRQARENLKKLRGMVRRAQNRGYATLSRIADHLERLAVGDESNAAIDAIDAVSLMTVHAAKGWNSRSSFSSTWVAAPEDGVLRFGSSTITPATRRLRLPITSRRPTKTRRRASAKRASGCCTWR